MMIIAHQTGPARSAAAATSAASANSAWVRNVFSRRQTRRMPATAQPRRVRKALFFTVSGLGDAAPGRQKEDLRRKRAVTGDAQGPLWKKWVWFVGLWAGGVLVVGSVGYLIRWWLHP